MKLFVPALRKAMRYSFATKFPQTLVGVLVLIFGFQPANAQFKLGENPGYYGSQYTDQQLYDLMYAGGARATRSTVSVQYYLQYGMGTYQARLQYPYSKGMRNSTFCLDATGGPVYTGQSTATASNGARSWLPNGIYNAPFNSDGSINTSNLWAKYCYDVVQSVGSYFTFFEVWNEPDLTGSVNAYEDSTQSASSWEKVEPASGDLPNMNASVEDYVQLCKIANQVIKKYQPSAKIATGGLGYSWFYLWFLKKGGGQWVDELSLHYYPYWSWTVCSWTGSSCGPAGFHRNSDYAVQAINTEIANFRTIETEVGGTHLPVMITESNIPRWSYVSAANLEVFPNNRPWGNDATQKNFTIKAYTKMMEAGLDVFCLYQTGETGDSGQNNGLAKSEIDAMGMYKNLVNATPGKEVLTNQGIAIRTMQRLLGNYKVDASQPSFPSGVDGVRFDSSGNKIYAIWAITTQDMSETASGSYTLPSGTSFKKFLYDGSSPGNVSGTVSLIGDPYILVQSSGSVSGVNCNAGPNQSIATSSTTLDASASTATNSTINSYAWSQLSGPNTASISSGTQVKATASNLVAGTYTFQVKIKDASKDSCSSTVQVTVQSTTQPSGSSGSGLSPTVVLTASQTITLPTNSVWLIGSGSYEANGSIASYSWSQVSGPSTATLGNTGIATTQATNMIAGTYVFKLTVTDASGVKATATTTIVVQAKGTAALVGTQTLDSSTAETSVTAAPSAVSAESTNKLLLFPNPAQNTLNVQLNSDTTGEVIIMVYNTSGQAMTEQRGEKSGSFYQVGLNISRLSTGAYFMRISVGQLQHLVAKFVKD